jgi:hypothetical protein
MESNNKYIYHNIKFQIKTKLIYIDLFRKVNTMFIVKCLFKFIKYI